MNPKNPDDCRDLSEVRAAIDATDREILNLLARRSEYVRAAAKFKTDASSVRAEERQRAMLARRIEWAEENDLDPDFVEDLYKLIVAHFVDREMQDWGSSR